MDEPNVTPEPTIAPPAPGLHRSATHRLIGGVAGGIGERFDIDPNIVRVIFVVLTIIWGLGAAIYLAMWVLIPRDPDGSQSVLEGQLPESRSRWPFIALAVGIAVLALIFVSTAGGAPRFGAGLGMLWLLFLAVLAALALRVPRRRLGFARILAVLFLLAVSGVIVVAGAVLGFLASTGVPLKGGSGIRAWQPTSVIQVQYLYQTEFGSSNVDLSGVEFPASGFAFRATVGVGTLRIDVPSDAVVDLRTHVGIGTVEFQQYRNGYFSGRFEAVPPSVTTVAGQASAPHLTIDAEVGIGQLVVVRSSAVPTP